MIALYPGSFDPPHLGHLDLIARASAVCDRLVVGIARNPDKTHTWNLDQRVTWMRRLCAGNPKVEIVAYDGATVTFARNRGISVLVRGLRNHADFEAEQAMATVNRRHGCETLLLMSAPAHAHLSSRTVRMVLAAGLPIDDLVPAEILGELVARP